MPLTDAQLKQLQPKEKPYKAFDGGGLYIEVFPDGAKRWRYKYRISGKEKRLALGVYPKVGLKDARKRHADAKAQLSEGLDPSDVKKATVAAQAGENSFAAIAHEWHAKFAAVQWSASHAKNIMARLHKNVFPFIGHRPVHEISAPEIIKMLRPIETNGHLETLHRTLHNCGQVFRYAIATSRATNDPTYKLGEAFPKPVKKHFSAITDPEELGHLLTAIDNYHGEFVVKCALQLAALTFLRPSELRLARWDEFHYETDEWIIPIIRMKRLRRDKEANPKEVHIVPLSRQSLAILQELRPLTGEGALVFPGFRGKDRPLSDAALTNALRRMGYGSGDMQVHGFRATARTMLHEQLGVDKDLIERQMSHTVDNPLGRAYDRTTFLPERRKMMQDWADYLDRLRAEELGKVSPIRAVD